ncbi:SusC/RagA family TonB-linked outer membrane protein [Gelidibacter salicanalis]|uniref:TonB-dependent receptor n=1 Tax=Gelidibacter salicanalis TaxID=291193 RepID=A0A934NKH7_9FLAO|nr:TonB-dependent receptor [Gelidibacter salicanalis]MBJ7880652.1 TonB-dependent receptor [Gelidibacter salicanalis]
MKIKFKLAVIALVMICTQSVFSQTKTLSGTVSDESGVPIPGVSVIAVGTTNGTSTDFDGNFNITILSNQAKTLMFSYIGYASQEVNVSNKTNFNIIMLEDQTQLDEVVVVGYGTVLKKDVTGAVTTVKVNADVAIQSNSVEQLLQGNAAGVQVTQNAGSLGSGISVKIRGANSLRGNNEPLYVIDGVIISSAGEDVIASGGVGNSGQENQNGLTGINPRDIESIQILKDASATAIYGSRGANGVVLITTKKGKNGKVKINSFITTSVRTITKKYDVLNGVDYANYQNEIDGLNGEDPGYEINGSQVFGVAYDAANNPTVSNTPAQILNWQDELYRQGFSTKVGMSASGGSDNGNYYISAGFDDQQGIVANSSLKSGDLRINLNQDLNENLKLETRVSGFFNSTDFTESGDLIGGSESFVNNVITFRPVITGEIEDLGQDLEAANPYSWVNDFSDFSKEKRYIGSLGLTYELPLEGLSYQIQAGGDVRTKDRRRFYGITTYQGANANGALQISTLNASSYQINNFLRFNRTFNNKHRINATAGVTYDVRNVENSIYAVEDFVTTELTTEQPFLASIITQPLQFFRSDQQIFSLLGRVNYTFNDKYILTASFRRDGVSKFSKNNRYGFFPSFAVAWRLEDEKFIKSLNLFEDLKLRAGWGQIGNHGIGPYGTLSNYGINGSLYGTPGNGTSVPLSLNNIANPNLTWETTEQLNFGLDFATKNNRFSGSIDMYDKTTKDLLQRSPIPTSSGFGTILINRGTISNKGLEVAFNVAPVSTDDFQINIGANIAFNKTKIETLGIPLKDFYIDGTAQQKSFYFGDNISRGLVFKSPANVFVEGEEMSLFYGYQTNGVYQTEDTDLTEGAKPGDIRIVDQNKDGKIDLLDRTFIGNPNPDFVYGFDLNFKLKRLTANFQFNGVYGNDIANGNLLRLGNAEGDGGNILTATYNNAWRPNSQSNIYPRIGFTTENRPAISDRIIEDGSYLRLNNVTIGYDIPVEKSKFFERLNVYIAGQNLVTWTHYSGYNPEITNFLYTGLINGVDWNGSPNASTILLGLNINF